MKRIFRFMLAAFMVVAVASCSNEFDEPKLDKPQDVELENIVISVAGETTRTYIGDDGKTINWREGDTIAIFDGYAKREFSIVEGSIEGKSASFEGQVAADATTLYAVYPYSAAVELEDNVVSVDAMQTQLLDGQNVANGAIVSIGSFNKGDESFVFNNVMGFMRANITADDVTSIIVEGSNIAGSVKVDASGVIKEHIVPASKVTLNPSGETFAVGSYYVALLPGTTPADEFKMTFVRNSGSAVELVSKKDVTIPRNGGFNTEYCPPVDAFVIKDAATLQTFLAEADGYKQGQVAKIVNDIDLTGVTLTTAPNFKGTLDGGGYALKNWESNGVALFDLLWGCVKNLTIDESCLLTAADAVGPFGFIANKIKGYEEAELNNVINNADITLNSTLYGAGSNQENDAVYFGTLVGESCGYIKNCVNNGDITINTTPTGGDERGFVFIGGIAGMVDTSTCDSLVGLSNCVNNGNISYSITGRGGFLFMGGIAGGTTFGAVTDTIDKYTVVDSCTNLGTIYHTFTQEIIGAGNKKSNYTKIAGVIGYCIGSVENCVNGAADDSSKGKIQLAAPIIVDGEGYSAAGVAVAGVTTYAFDKAVGCTNYGMIDVDGSFGPGYDYESYSGGSNKEKGGTFISGVVAQIGALEDVVATHEITNCHNYGVLDVNLPITKVSNTTNYKNYHHIGGVVAYANAAATNLSNNAAIMVVSQGTENYFGGVIGQTDYNATNITNNGDINYSISRVGGQQVNGSNQFFGGVIGYNTGDTMTSITNNNPVTLTINCTNQKIRCGGVAGSVGNVVGAENNGKVTLNDIADHGKEIDFGGVSGASTSGAISDVTNNGDVIYTGAKHTGSFYISGIIGKATSSLENVENSKSVTITATEIGNLYVGGVAGSASEDMKTVENSGDITVNVPTITKQYYIAGVAGAASSAAEYHDVDNSGAIFADAKACKKLYFGGISGHSGGNVKYYNCDNSGDMTFNAPELEAEELNMGGICSRPYSKSLYDTCTNSGAMRLVAKGATEACYIGGIAAQPSNATSAGNGYDVDGCTVSGDIYVDCPATWYIGGAIAYGSQWSSTESSHRSASGNVVESDITIASATIQHHVGGIIGHSGIHVDVCDNSYTGTISVGSNDASKLSNVGGIIGTWAISQTSKTTPMNAEFAMSGNVVDADVNYDATAGYGGMLVGAVNNLKLNMEYTTYSQITLSFDGDTIKSGSTINGTEITNANYADYAISSYDYTGRYEMTVNGIDSIVYE